MKNLIKLICLALTLNLAVAQTGKKEDTPKDTTKGKGKTRMAITKSGGATKGGTYSDKKEMEKKDDKKSTEKSPEKKKK